MSDDKRQPYWMIGVPTYNGQVDMACAQAVRGAVVSRPVAVRSVYSRSSLLPQAFNELLCAALNDEACVWFAMLHADVGPEQGWLSKLVDIAIARNLDVLSVVLPLRDDTGITSTAIDTPDGSDYPSQRRLTIRETLSLPPTFTGDDVAKMFGAARRPLLINTGCMLLRMDALRAFGAANRLPGFQLDASIRRGKDGRYFHWVEPEDWRFSRWASRQKLAVAATHEVRAVHHGADAPRPNHIEWGLWDTDRDWTESQRRGVPLEEAAAISG